MPTQAARRKSGSMGLRKKRTRRREMTLYHPPLLLGRTPVFSSTACAS
jgi:hypothetical protein